MMYIHSLHHQHCRWLLDVDLAAWPAPNFLSAVTVRSPSSAWAAGYYDKGGSPDRTLTEYWNGRVWKTVASPNS
jgi:hypothetical protein